MSEQLVIIIGLPCCGKTTLCQKYKEKDYNIFDDFIFNFYNGELIGKLHWVKKFAYVIHGYVILYYSRNTYLYSKSISKKIIFIWYYLKIIIYNVQ